MSITQHLIETIETCGYEIDNINWPELAARAGYDFEWVDAEVRANVVSLMRGEEVNVCEDCGHTLPDVPDHEVHRDGDIYEVFACKNAECGGTTQVCVAWIPDWAHTS